MRSDAAATPRLRALRAWATALGPLLTAQQQRLRDTRAPSADATPCASAEKGGCDPEGGPDSVWEPSLNVAAGKNDLWDKKGAE